MKMGILPSTPEPISSLMQGMMQTAFVTPRLGAPKLSLSQVDYGITTRKKRCGNCAFYIPPTKGCILVEGEIAPNGLCDIWLRDVTKAPILTFQGMDINDFWRIVGQKNWYAHNIVEVFPDQGMVVIEDGSPMRNRFGMPLEFINMHTHNNHGWSDEEVRQFLF